MLLRVPKRNPRLVARRVLTLLSPPGSRVPCVATLEYGLPLFQALKMEIASEGREAVRKGRGWRYIAARKHDFQARTAYR